MTKWLLFFICLVVLAQTFKVKIEEADEDGGILSAKLPAYIGSGYHALKGNPYTNRID